MAVKNAAARLTARSRAGQGPGFLEVVTYRWRGHVGPSEDQDVGVKRKEDLNAWKQRDPIKRLFEALTLRGDFDASAFSKMQEEVTFQLEHEFKRAEKAPYPALESNLARVYRNADPR